MSSHPKHTFAPNLFANKVLFCTGGRSGICYKIVETMMHFGVDAVIVGRDAKGLQESADQLSKTTGKKCLAAPADVRDQEAVKGAVEVANKEFGKIDFVICGAAGNFLSPISGLSQNAFKTVIDIDLLGTYNTIKATLPHIRSSKGSYIHISATLHYSGTPWQAHVSAAKAGVDALSAVLAVEEGPRGVRSNVIAPGPIGGTVGIERLLPNGAKPGRMVPLARMGDSGETTLVCNVDQADEDEEDIANAAVFLFSPAANWVTGNVMVVDGGSNHVSQVMLPYPEALLDPDSVKDLIKAKPKL